MNADGEFMLYASGSFLGVFKKADFSVARGLVPRLLSVDTPAQTGHKGRGYTF